MEEDDDDDDFKIKGDEGGKCFDKKALRRMVKK